jgi:hypothetical protein
LFSFLKDTVRVFRIGFHGDSKGMDLDSGTIVGYSKDQLDDLTKIKKYIQAS